MIWIFIKYSVCNVQDAFSENAQHFQKALIAHLTKRCVVDPACGVSLPIIEWLTQVQTQQCQLCVILLSVFLVFLSHSAYWWKKVDIKIFIAHFAILCMLALKVYYYCSLTSCLFKFRWPRELLHFCSFLEFKHLKSNYSYYTQ